MIDFIVISLGIVCWRTEGAKFWPLFLFTVPVLLYHITPVDGLWIYLIGALIDLCVILLLNCMVKIDRYTLMIGMASGLSILFNLAGWVRYELYYEPDLYNQAFVALYAVILVLSLGVKKSNGLRDHRSLNIIRCYT